MNEKQILAAIENATSLIELLKNGFLPEPNDNDKFYFFYFSHEDFKPALKDIVLLSNSGLNIWYDRKQESGHDWEETMLARVRDFHCAAVVFYLSESAAKSDFFWCLCKFVIEHHINYCSVKPTDRNIFSSLSPHEMTYERAMLIDKLFGEEITYVPYSISVQEKIIAIERIGKGGNLIYSLIDGVACVLCVKDLSEEEIVIPATTEIAGIEYPVRRIAPQAFINCKRLRTIIIPDSIEYIGHFDEIHEDQSFGQVFYGCQALEEIVLPAELKILLIDNFSGCTSLKKLYCGTKIEKVVGDMRDFEGIEELKLPPIIKRTQEGIFLYHDKTWRILNFPQITHIYGYEDMALTEDYIPPKSGFVGELYTRSAILRRIDASEVERDLHGDFSGCINLEEVILPPQTQELSSRFSRCAKLNDIHLPNTLEKIGGEILGIGGLEIFSECQFKTFTIPENVSYFDKTTFYGASVETLISNSQYNDKIMERLFAKQNQYNQLVERFAMAFKRHPKLSVAFCSPIIFLDGLFHAFLAGSIWTLALILTFPISFFVWLLREKKSEKPFDIGELFLKSGSYKKIPRGWKRTESSMRGYDRFIKKRGWSVKNDENALKADS